MKLSNIIIVPKLSKYEWDKHRLNLTHDEIIEKYKKEGVNFERIIESHKAQKKSLEELKEILPESKFVSRDNLTKEKTKSADAVISFGGDNHFTYVSHFVEDTPMIGINSDPTRSEGALVYFNIKNIKVLLEKIRNDEFSIEKWPRIKVVVNGKEMGLATSEVFSGEKDRIKMSRHMISYKDIQEEQKGSGFLVLNGVGSTGWYNSACRYLHKDGNVFEKTLQELRFLVMEPYRGRLNNPKNCEGTIKDGELSVVSLNDSEGIISMDSLFEFPFKEGSKMLISIGKSLNVVRID